MLFFIYSVTGELLGVRFFMDKWHVNCFINDSKVYCTKFALPYDMYRFIQSKWFIIPFEPVKYPFSIGNLIGDNKKLKLEYISKCALRMDESSEKDFSSFYYNAYNVINKTKDPDYFFRAVQQFLSYEGDQ